MKCQLYECQNEATPGFLACNSNHGQAVSKTLNFLPKLFQAGNEKNYLRKYITIPEVEHYSKL